MMKRPLLALLTGVIFMSSACAAETENTPPTAFEPSPSKGSEFLAPDAAWRDLDPENTLYIDTDYGRIIVELYPEIAPAHVKQIKTLTREKFYDYVTFHRVISGFMNQGGDPKGDGTGQSKLPNIPAEFTFRLDPEMNFIGVTEQKIDPDNPASADIGVGFYKALPIASQPSLQAMLTKDGKVAAYGLHCKGVTSMARATNPDSANSQFFLMRGTAPHLDRTYSIWGVSVWGREHLTKFKVGDKGQDPNFVPDVMKRVRIAADLPERERLNIQILRPDAPEFALFLQTQKNLDGSYPALCDITLPTRIKP